MNSSRFEHEPATSCLRQLSTQQQWLLEPSLRTSCSSLAVPPEPPALLQPLPHLELWCLAKATRAHLTSTPYPITSTPYTIKCWQDSGTLDHTKSEQIVERPVESLIQSNALARSNSHTSNHHLPLTAMPTAPVSNNSTKPAPTHSASTQSNRIP